jgi:hypothetical protein
MNQKFGITMSTVLSFILLLPLSLNKKSTLVEAESEPPSHIIVKTVSPALDKPKFIESSAVAISEPVAIVEPIPEPTKAPVAKIKPIVVADMTDKEYIKQRICEVWGPLQCANAIKIAQLESGLRTNARSSSNDFGVMQVNCTAHAKKVGGDCTKLYDLETNLRVAKQIYDGSKGWSPWTTSKMLASY